MLFLFISNLSNIQYLCHFKLFADYTTIAFSNKKMSDIENIINEILVFIHKLLSNNRVYINIEKTNLYYFTGHGLNINKYVYI